MTWALGWSLSCEYSVQYVVERGLHKREDLTGAREKGKAYFDAANDIASRADIFGLQVETCWVGNDIEVVYVLAFDRKATSPDNAKAYEDDLPASPRRCRRLGRLTGNAGPPQWYKVVDNTYDPSVGYLHPKENKPEQGGDTGGIRESDDDGEGDDDDGDDDDDETEDHNESGPGEDEDEDTESDSSYDWDSDFD